MFVLHKFGADLSGYFIHCFLSRRVTGEPCIHVRIAWELIDVWNLKIRAVKRVFCNGSRCFGRGPSGHDGPHSARGRRETAERGKSWDLAVNCDGGCGAVCVRASDVDNIKMVRSRTSKSTLRWNWDFVVLLCATFNAPLSIDIYQCRTAVMTSVVFLRWQHCAKLKKKCSR